jgi:hypothetical protein
MSMFEHRASLIPTGLCLDPLTGAGRDAVLMCDADPESLEPDYNALATIEPRSGPTT